MQIKKYNRLLLSIFTGVLLSLSWLDWGSGLSLLIAFIPLLFVEEYLYKNRQNNRSVVSFLYAFLAFVVWNSIDTWWIYYASFFGALAAILLNATLMGSVFWLFHITKRKMGSKLGYISLVTFWIAFEYFHLNWDLTWSWLTIGNGFAKDVFFIQWYEYTGALGGTLWVLATNILFFTLIKHYINFSNIKAQQKCIYFLLALVFVPVIISVIKYNTYKEDVNPYNIVVVQPNIDPYNEKFSGLSANEQLVNILTLADSLSDENTDYIVAPETAITHGIWAEDLKHHEAIKICRSLTQKYPKAKLISGVSTYKLFEKGEEPTYTARPYRGGEDMYYDRFNSSIQVDTTDSVGLYHKSKLVHGVEKMPFPGLLGFLEEFALDLGGIVGTLGTQEERSVFKACNDTISVSTAICYESIFGEYTAEHVKNGSNFIFVITNDGWWEDTPGYKQHFNFSRLRAIENRRSVARSANTGISCFINQKGTVSKATNWWVPDVISTTLNANAKITFYTKYGDYIGRISSFLAVMIIFFTFSRSLIKRKKIGDI